MKLIKGKYRRFQGPKLLKRRWPNRTLRHAPIWCSVDLRDGNQALASPMTVEQKIEMFNALVACGLKEIEVGFPASSDTEFRFIRTLIEDGLIPPDVTIQVLVQAREDQIEKTVEALVGAKKVIIHLYNSTSPAQRRIVFGLTKPEIVRIAVQGTKWVKKYSANLKGTKVVLQYSPESFSATEPDFALEICHAVMQEWGPTSRQKMILNLPSTVEVSMPNVYADQVEWFIRHLKNRKSVIISLHTHNDRGTGVAATELGLLAGADRVEGTLFGNGERTGNADIITVALNLYTHGIEPGLDFSNLDKIREVYERCTGMKVPERQPYSGELVFTAFSGSHQDAIKKGFAAQAKRAGGQWNVPYLTIDPKDVDRTYEEVIRINSQSGRGGIAYLLQKECGIKLPDGMKREFGPIAKCQVDQLGREVSAEELKKMFWGEYVTPDSPWKLSSFTTENCGQVINCDVALLKDGHIVSFKGQGNGPLSAFTHALNHDGSDFDTKFTIEDGFEEHALGSGVGTFAIAYVKIKMQSSGEIFWGAGLDPSLALAPVRAVLSAINRSIKKSTG